MDEVSYRREDLKERIAAIQIMRGQGVSDETIKRERRIAEVIRQTYEEISPVGSQEELSSFRLMHSGSTR